MPPKTGSKTLIGKVFVFTRELAAPRELVFQAWTEAKHLAQWWGPKGFTNPVCEWDARPGGKIYDVMRAPNGTDFPMGGEFREIVTPERLVFSCGALDEQGKLLFEFLHTVTFAEQSGKTKLTIQSRVTMTTPEANHYIRGFEMGMTLSLERLARQLAQMETFPKLPAFARENFMTGWTQLIGSSLKETLEPRGGTADREIVVR